MNIQLMPDPDSPAIPRPAATVAVLRDGPGGVETFLLKRHGKSGFFPGAHVFPGGRVDLEDADVPVEGGREDRDRMGAAGAAAYQVAAVRETLEEAGILLARGRATPADRAALQRREATFGEVAAARGWVVDASGLAYWSWWITPLAEHKRYDTRFFIAAVTGQDEARHCGEETVDSEWIRPADAIARSNAGEIFLAPPTYITLQELAGYGTTAAALAAAPGRETPPIMPRLGQTPTGFAILLPGDPLHPSALPVPGPTRLVWDGGRWEVSGYRQS
jgi:8-oxo-dGTP pyrophosphatase MutT (NUDIX family)